MVDYPIENKREIVKRLKRLPPSEDDPASKVLKHPDDWKIKDASKKIAEYLYGDVR